MDALISLASAIGQIATPVSLFNVAWATLLGMCVGMMPGLTATLGIALLTTLTFRMGAGDAILILICMYVGAIYGGSRTAILLNIPGTPANAASAFWRIFSDMTVPLLFMRCCPAECLRVPDGRAAR